MHRGLHHGHDRLKRIRSDWQSAQLMIATRTRRATADVLYADAVVGWSWIYFRDYDFAGNPLGFSESVLPILKQNGQA